MTTSWAPVLTGADAERALQTASGIAAALRSLPDDLRGIAHGPSVSSGAAGVALFFAALHEVTGDQRDADEALAFADAAIESSQQADTNISLFAGQVGVGWALHQLEGRLYDEDPDEDDVDELVEASLGRRPWSKTYDLINGVVGLGVYGLDRLPRPAGARTVRAVIEILASMAEETPDGTTWRTTPWMLPQIPVMAERISRWPHGYYDIGLSHGVSGAVAFLAFALDAGCTEAKALLEPAARWLRAQRLDDIDHADHGHAADADCGAQAGRYPLMRGPDERGGPGRVAWCYGDPSVSVALLAAGRALHDGSLVDEAVRLATATARIRPELTGVADAGLCHGAAGLGHVFSRLAHATGDDLLRSAARAWLLAALDLHEPGAGVGGYVSLQPDRNAGTFNRVSVPGVLEGSSGIGLALLAGISNRVPTWDHLLLLSTPEAP